MHKSKLSGFIIDCQSAELAGAASFWSAALGLRVAPLPPEEEKLYRRLQDHQHGLHIEVQTVTHPSRVHLDIETDHIEAEVLRLEQLGARRVHALKDWWVMEAPSGHRFCVVQATAHSEAFEALATEWP